MLITILDISTPVDGMYVPTGMKSSLTTVPLGRYGTGTYILYGTGTYILLNMSAT